MCTCTWPGCVCVAAGIHSCRNYSVVYCSMHNILKGKIVGGVLAALGIVHLSQLLLVQSFCTMITYTVPRIVAVLMDGWLWHIFYFMLVEKTNLSSLIPLTMVQWYIYTRCCGGQPTRACALQKCKGCCYPFSGHLSCKLYTSCQDWEFPFSLTTNSLLVYLISKQLCGHSKRNIPISDRMFIECATEITIKVKTTLRFLQCALFRVLAVKTGNGDSHVIISQNIVCACYVSSCDSHRFIY